jgi:membrane protein implicated in regulation of membrane protease activity
MNTLFIILIALFALATAYVLVRGIATMASGKDISRQQSNRYMSMRVMLQGITIALVVILLLLGGRGLTG